MIYIFSHRFLAIVFSLLLLDSLLWWGLDAVLRRRRIRPGWRIGLAVFFAGEIAGVALYIAARRIALPVLPLSAKAGISALLIWHCLLLLPLLLVLVLSWLAAGVVSLAGRAEKSKPPTPDSLSRRRFLGIAAAAVPPLLTTALTGGALEQLNQFRINRRTLAFPNLPPGLDGLKIAHLSDLHVGRLTEGAVLDRMVAETNALGADLIAVTGDLINYSLADLPHAVGLLQRLRAPLGVAVCEGNHDLFEDSAEFDRQLRASGLLFLRNESTLLSVGGTPLQLLGLRWTGSRDSEIAPPLDSLLRLRMPGIFSILMAHHPHAFDPAAAAGVPLVLSGHTHGGQLMLTDEIGVGPLMFRYWSGLYRKGESQLIVSNGVGNWFPLRINAPAEIALLTLRAG